MRRENPRPDHEQVLKDSAASNPYKCGTDHKLVTPDYGYRQYEKLADISEMVSKVITSFDCEYTMFRDVMYGPHAEKVRVAWKRLQGESFKSTGGIGKKSVVGGDDFE